MSSVVTAQDLGLTKIANWLKFPPDEHPGWSWETVAGVDLTFSQDESGGYVLTGQAAPGIEVA
jgi:hypothetical protein